MGDSSPAGHGLRRRAGPLFRVSPPALPALDSPRALVSQAKEKEEEIHVKTEEEYNLQKLALIMASKAKIREEFKKKEDALQVKNRMYAARVPPSRCLWC